MDIAEHYSKQNIQYTCRLIPKKKLVSSKHLLTKHVMTYLDTLIYKHLNTILFKYICV